MISIVIPFKYDSNNRLENILSLIEYVKKHWVFGQLIVVEMDNKPKLMNILPEWCDYIFVKEEPNSKWSRSKRINIAIPLIKSEITMILDTDVIIDGHTIEFLVDKLIKNEIDAATPFNEIFHVSRECVLKEIKKNKLNVLSFLNNNKDNISRIFKVNGACFLTKTNIFKHIRGMNELFIGWGWEDDELISRYIALGYRYVRANTPAVHINHERTVGCVPDPDNFELSITEKNRIKIMNDLEIMEYFGIKKSPGLYCSLTEPQKASDPKLIDIINSEKIMYTSVESEEYKI